MHPKPKTEKMRQIEILYAEVLCDGRRYIYSPDGRPADMKTGEPYCRRDDVGMELLVALEASHLYSAEPDDDTPDPAPRSQP